MTSGDQDPIAPYAGFQGHVGRTFAGSRSWWPPETTAPEDAPNVLIVLVDDLGYSDLGCFGSEIDTPNIDSIADRGLRYTNFHVTPMCSPTRAALLTGLNPHDAGIGTVVHSDAGFPGYAMELTEHSATIAEVLRSNGYSTMMVGKWHLTKDSNQNAAGDKSSWPCQRGFDRYYGVLDAFTNLHHPHRIVEDNHQIEVDEYPEGYFFTDDLTDRAISMIRESKASNPTKPFFMYFAHGAVHAPLHAKVDDIEKYRGAYEAGWDDLRTNRYERQLELGVVEEGTALAPRNTEVNNDVRPWDELSDDERLLFARYMEVYAAMVDNLDQNMGRLVQALEESGDLDNTIIMFASDNGASREGEAVGTTAYYVHLLQGDDVEADLERIDLIGGPRTTPHYPRGWAMLGNTPFRLYKINTHAGGHTVPFIVSWPRKLGSSIDEPFRRQYTHVTDILPTLAELIGIELPSERNGLPLKPLAGSSFVGTITDHKAPTLHAEQHYEMIGNRGYYRDGWEVVTLHQPLTPFDDGEWELYNLIDDPTEIDDLSSQHPELRDDLAAAWDEAARRYQVYPLDEGSAVKYILRPPSTDVYSQPVKLVRGTPTLERWRSVQLVWFRGAEFAVDLDFRSGDSGYIFTHGDQGSGYGLYVLDDELVFIHNNGRGKMQHLSAGPIPDGTRKLACEFVAPGGNVWDVTLYVAGVRVSSLEGVPMLFGIAPFEGINVGIDRRSPVSWEIHQRFGTFAYTGKLNAVTITPGERAPDAPENMIEVLREMGRQFE